jgi:pyridoxamine 5'-phosphate oxidase
MISDENVLVPTLRRSDLDPDPFKQFAKWFEQALAANLVAEPNAMTLATATPEGFPSARMVLLKEFDERGFVFYSNYESQKGRELSSNPYAALVLYWAEQGRQVRIQGKVVKVAPEESSTYFHSRPRGSQLAAMASQQDQVLPDRSVLERAMEELAATFKDREIPRPNYWGGFRIAPSSIEFWQHRPNRLHDRFRYTLEASGHWLIERLSP